MPSHFFCLIATVAALAFVWWRLVDHLRLEWTLNPQYAYGWSVPLLCLYLAWERLRQRTSADSIPESNQENEERLAAWTRNLVVGGLALLWLVVRLVQEANPEWRLVSWALAVVVLGLTLILLNALRRLGIGPRIPELVFPLTFILLAVPWPSAIEEPLIQGLTRATAALTSEVLNLTGTPAVQRGNLVEVAPGIVGIEDGCSGIRSLQAALMVSVFFGGLYRLRLGRRLGLILAGFILAFGFNVARTTVLAFVLATRGTVASNAWHDPLSLFLPLACFGSLALLALRERKKGKDPNQSRSRDPVMKESDSKPNAQAWLQFLIEPPRQVGRRSGFSAKAPTLTWGIMRNSGWIAPALVLWLGLVEVAAQAWYRLHEARLPPPVTWGLVLPSQAGRLEERLPSVKAKQMLRFNGGQDASWEDAAGRRWQAIFLRWDAGRIAARLVKDHTPAVCLGAAGRKLLAEPASHIVPIGGLQMRVYRYTASDERRGKVHIFYCVREDRGLEESRLAPDSFWQERLDPVLRGRRNCGQRSLELALWGIEEDEAAWAALSEQMQRIVRIDSPAADS